jgi:hypothetical protein
MPDQPTTVSQTKPSSGRQPLVALVLVIALAYAWGAGLALLQVL